MQLYLLQLLHRIVHFHSHFRFLMNFFRFLPKPKKLIGTIFLNWIIICYKHPQFNPSSTHIINMYFGFYLFSFWVMMIKTFHTHTDTDRYIRIDWYSKMTVTDTKEFKTCNSSENLLSKFFIEYNTSIIYCYRIMGTKILCFL